MTAPQTIAAGKVVSIHYKLTLDGGQVVDSSEGREPLAYLHGAGHIVAGLERALEGKAVGESLEVVVTPEDGYGPHHPETIHTVPRGAFPVGADLHTGLAFQARDENQNPLMGTITKVEGDDITVDFNHPLAGQTLNFAVSIEDVRDATAEERAHGHAH